MAISNNLIKIFKLILVFSFLTIYLSLNQMFEFSLLENMIIFCGLLFLFTFLVVLLNNQKVKRPTKIIIKSKVPKAQKKYLGSTQTKTYHTKDCRFSKLIKANHKIEEDNREYFKKLKFTPCKICKPNIR